jgi:peptidoglycan L-alanyl-D-glutamate endopeptidase CwlK
VRAYCDQDNREGEKFFDFFNLYHKSILLQKNDLSTIINRYMSYSLGPRSLSFCKHVDPKLIAVIQHALSISTQDAGFAAEQSRTQAEEDALVAKGLSHSRHSHHIVDCNPAWAAKGYSGAADLVPWNGKAFVWDFKLIFPLVSAMKQASIDLTIPITWGGCWDKLLTEYKGSPEEEMKSYVARHIAAGNPHPFTDGPHFELGRN